MMVGEGGYGSVNANAHLQWIAVKRLGLKDTGLRGLGSTWYGPSGLMIAAAKSAVHIMHWMHTQEYTQYEKCCNGIDGWPNWHWPVQTMYGGHIVLNQLGPDNVQKSAVGVAEMDAYSTSRLSLDSSIKHIHCWHTDDLFSKFAFDAGKYKDMNLTDYMNMNSSLSYATTIAISSDRLTLEELKVYISDPLAIKENAWIRQFSA